MTPCRPRPDPQGEELQQGPGLGRWADARRPKGFRVNRYAGELNNPRWLYVTPNGDVLVAEANTELKDDKAREKARRDGKLQSQNYGRSADRITLLRDTDGDGVAEQRVTFLDGLRQPLGMQVVGDWFYVANTDALWRYPYQPGDLKIHGEGEKILDLPAGGYNNHWTRNILANADNSKLYISVGSASNLGDHGMQEEERRANILEINPDGSGERIFASGLRNPVGMGWAPGTQDLWTVVNERDNLGEDLVPDYLAKVEAGAFYGWPYAYFGPNEDPRLAGKRPDLVARARKPELSWARIPHRSAWPSTPSRPSPSATATVRSSASTARGTAARSPATRWFSCRSRTVSRAVRRRISSPASSRMRTRPRSSVARRASPCCPAARCWWRMMPATVVAGSCRTLREI